MQKEIFGYRIERAMVGPAVYYLFGKLGGVYRLVTSDKNPDYLVLVDRKYHVKKIGGHSLFTDKGGVLRVVED